MKRIRIKPEIMTHEGTPWKGCPRKRISVFTNDFEQTKISEKVIKKGLEGKKLNLKDF